MRALLKSSNVNIDPYFILSCSFVQYQILCANWILQAIIILFYQFRRVFSFETSDREVASAHVLEMVNK
jgi:hypothetical protein